MDGDTVAIIDDGGAARTRFRSERRAHLVAPEDDMWAQLAEDAVPHAILVDGVVGGYCTLDDDRRLRSFHVTDGFDLAASEVFAHVVGSMGIGSALPSTVDPMFLTLSLAIGGAVRPVGLMYDHVVEPTSRSADLHLAHDDDHREIVAFDHDQTGSPFDFLEPYVAARIARGELAVLVGDDGRIRATGECRTDTRSTGYAHLGLIVRRDDRNRGVGTSVLTAMVELARARGLRPLCSTEPSNVAARHVIQRAGFRQRHSVLSVAMAPA